MTFCSVSVLLNQKKEEHEKRNISNLFKTEQHSYLIQNIIFRLSWLCCCLPQCVDSPFCMWPVCPFHPCFLWGLTSGVHDVLPSSHPRFHVHQRQHSPTSTSQALLHFQCFLVFFAYPSHFILLTIISHFTMFLIAIWNLQCLYLFSVSSRLCVLSWLC